MCVRIHLIIAVYGLTVLPDVLAHTNKTVLPYPASPIRFRTFPDSRLPTGSHFRFVVSSCLQPNFPYAPFKSRRIKGFDLLADYLFEPTIVDTLGVVKASDNVTESPAPLESNIGSETNGSVPEAIPATLEAKRVAPTEFMLFLVRGCFVPHHSGILTRHRVTLSTPTSQFTTAILSTPTVVYTGATTTALVCARFMSDFVSPTILSIHVDANSVHLAIIHTYDDHEVRQFPLIYGPTLNVVCCACRLSTTTWANPKTRHPSQMLTTHSAFTMRRVITTRAFPDNITLTSVMATWRSS